MQRKSLLLAAVLLLCVGAGFVTGQFYDDDDEEEHVLLDNKCKSIKVTSKMVPSKENPQEKILQRNIKIRVPLKARENISDPISPLRTNFVYNLAQLFKKCDPVLASQGNCNADSEDVCYAYDRNKCYTWDIPFISEGKTIIKRAALNPESCYE
ncbi:immunoglobulin J chain [Spea bombifrons]|uniref:immunoglobulin J chain n=1 Tax=Spea bombifrons TaxID=233779 RepID=UPI00234BEA82|nr:immunoglobulin J chain [Spea bombifrons]